MPPSAHPHEYLSLPLSLLTTIIISWRLSKSMHILISSQQFENSRATLWFSEVQCYPWLEEKNKPSWPSNISISHTEDLGLWWCPFESHLFPLDDQLSNLSINFPITSWLTRKLSRFRNRNDDFDEREKERGQGQFEINFFGSFSLWEPLQLKYISWFEFQ